MPIDFKGHSGFVLKKHFFSRLFRSINCWPWTLDMGNGEGWDGAPSNRQKALEALSYRH
jgi:hypothetical protein